MAAASRRSIGGKELRPDAAATGAKEQQKNCGETPQPRFVTIALITPVTFVWLVLPHSPGLRLGNHSGCVTSSVDSETEFSKSAIRLFGANLSIGLPPVCRKQEHQLFRTHQRCAKSLWGISSSVERYQRSSIGQRRREIHLSFQRPTKKSDTAHFGALRVKSGIELLVVRRSCPEPKGSQRSSSRRTIIRNSRFAKQDLGRPLFQRRHLDSLLERNHASRF